ncbi:Alginate lyase [Bryocella elongata]|uniref:Alginate lyase n=1 Tax=Bryocella elongata TaxID=863522 RepID=A0A1H5UCS7_9BACT|nr:alginate lyase family protein [Bryocella elongata]SEF72850.1 Alginate lyase [Bryocella elongata]
MKPTTKFIILFTLAIFHAAALRAEHVVNPKASLIDVRARQAELRNNQDFRVSMAVNAQPMCSVKRLVAAPPSPMVIKPYYLSGSSGPTDPEAIAQMNVYNDFEKRITAGMNRYVALGDEGEAQCAQRQIDEFAKGGALLSFSFKVYPQTLYQVEWTLSSAAITESVLMNDRNLDQAMVKRDIAWMNQVAQKMIQGDKEYGVLNNHHYWTGLAAVAVGVVSSDDSLFTWGVNVFRSAVNQLNSAGAFPLEMSRSELAIHYDGFALQALIPLAEFAERQGVNLYAYRSPTGKSISDAMNFFASAVADPSVVNSFQSAPQKLDPDNSDFFSFAEFYARRFGSQMPSSMRRMLRRPNYSSRIGGSTTVLAAPLVTPR